MEDNQSNYCKGLLNSLIRQYTSRIRLLPCKPEETVEATIRALWLCSLGVRASSVEALDLPLTAPTDAQMERLTELLESRARGVPLAYLTSRQTFMGLEYRCCPAALIPRKETEILGQTACRILKETILPMVKKPRVLDLCTGSGNLACAVAHHVPECSVFASDVSAEAVSLARENAKYLACETRVTIFVGDLFEPFNGSKYGSSFDLIICNPPYISTSKLPQMAAEIIEYEPRTALDAGPFGLGILSRLLRDAPRFAKPGGWLAFEVGYGQGSGLMRRLSQDERFKSLSGARDYQNNVRAIAAQFSSGN